MTSRGINLVLTLVLVLVWGLTLATRQDRSRRSRSFMPEMAFSLTHEAQGESRWWPGGAPPPPPEGTIPRGHPPLRYRATKEDAQRAGRELRSPFAKDEAARTRGARVFANYCFPCHGPAGLGDGPVTKAGVPAPPSLLGDSARKMADGRVFHIITYGQGNMPGHGAQIPREDRWKATLHIRELQRAAGVEAAAPADGARD